MRIFSKLVVVSIFFVFTCCKNKESNGVSVKRSDIEKVVLISDSLKENLTEDFSDTIVGELETKLLAAGLVNIQDLNENIWVDLKYTTKDNFLGKDLYGELNKAYLQVDLAKRLSIVQDSLSSIDSNLHLLVYDAVRPRSVQQMMWDAMDTIPINDRVKFVSNPRNGSVHNYACAVDLTICNSEGVAFDMGAGYDDMRKIAYPKHEAKFLASGELTDVQVENRLLLRKIMRYGGYRVLSTEWWHFNGLSRDAAKATYNIIE